MNLHVIHLFSFSLLSFRPPGILLSSNNAKDVTDIRQSEIALKMKISEKSNHQIRYIIQRQIIDDDNNNNRKQLQQ
jgi:hypothetical protein